MSRPPTRRRASRLQIRILLPSGPLVHHPGDASSHRMTLDVKRGALIGECCLLKAPGVGIRLRTLRVVSLSERALGLQLIQLEIEDGEWQRAGKLPGLACPAADRDRRHWR
jgi:hypothetical protein